MSEPSTSQRSPIPITLITGFLGSGKTTLLLNLLPQLPHGYRLAFVKNELGDTTVDSQLASQSGIEVTKELEGGCICCNLTGQLDDALETLAAKGVERIVVETSGSAFPATLAMAINELSLKTLGRYVLDGVVSVIDVMNWKGYEDTSYTARQQARYTDLIVLNKWEEAGEEKLDDVLERLGALELGVSGEDIGKVKSQKGWVDKEVLLGLDSSMAKTMASGEALSGPESNKERRHDNSRHDSEVEVLTVTLKSENQNMVLNMEAFEKLLASAPKDEVYRIKAIARASEAPKSSDGKVTTPGDSSDGIHGYILNWAFGRWTFTAMEMQSRRFESNDLQSAPERETSNTVLQMTMIFARFESAKWERRLKAGGIIEPLEKSCPFDLRVKLSG